MNRQAQEPHRDPVVIAEWAHLRRNARRGFIVCFSALGLTFAISALAIALMSEPARVVTILLVFTVAVIIFLVTIPIINRNHTCPACGQPPILPTYEVRWFAESDGPYFESLTVCECCGAALK